MSGGVAAKRLVLTELVLRNFSEEVALAKKEALLFKEDRGKKILL